MTDAPMLVKRTTIEEFEAFIALPENAHRRFELIHGEIVEREMPSYKHQTVSKTLFLRLNNFVDTNDLGEVLYEVHYRANPNDTHNDRIPDISFTMKSRIPAMTDSAVPQIPDLCVEIQSFGDSPREMCEKAAYYLANGAQQVWLLFTRKPLIEVMYPNGESDFYYPGDTLTGGDLLPGFEARIEDIFRTRE
ncbi:MAG: Uma2 family endonuclease [Chloroflexota bacterium]|nr:Uma2 family endonuclease [Chloroflexota bacterium]